VHNAYIRLSSSDGLIPHLAVFLNDYCNPKELDDFYLNSWCIDYVSLLETKSHYVYDFLFELLFDESLA